jgi:integrase
VNKAPNTYAMNRCYADRLREYFTGYLSELTAKQVEDYKVKRRGVVSPATVNRELALLKPMCTKAVEWGYLKANPLRSVRLLKEPPGRLRYLAWEEMGSLVKVCSPHLRPIVVTAMHTGMRKSEILGLNRQVMDLAWHAHADPMNPLKPLEDPTQGRPRRRLVDLVRHRPPLARHLVAQAALCHGIDQQCSGHHHQQPLNPTRFFHKQRRDKEPRIFEKSKAPFGRGLAFIGSNPLGIAQLARVTRGPHHKARFQRLSGNLPAWSWVCQAASWR